MDGPVCMHNKLVLARSLKLESKVNMVQGNPSPRGLGWVHSIWDVALSCLGSTAAAVQPNGLWNIPNRSQPNPGLRGDGSPCTHGTNQAAIYVRLIILAELRKKRPWQS